MTDQTPMPTSDLLVQVRAARAARDAAEVQLIELALAWAHAHSVESFGDPAGLPVSTYDPTAPLGVQADVDVDFETIEWHGLPPLRWDAPASFAAANRVSTTAGKAMLRDALVLHHRLPKVWARVVAGQVPVFRARRIAQAVLGQADDVTAYVDRQVVDRAHSVGVTTLDRLLDEAMLRLHAEEREIEQLEALDQRYARLEELSINHTGIATYEIRADLMDLTAFDDAVAQVAAALRREGSEESNDVRRSLAVGILADPTRALALLTGATAPSPKRRIVLTYHLTDGGLLGVDPIGLDTDGRPLLDQLVRQWCGRDDVRITVQPVLRTQNCRPEQDQGEGMETYRPTTADRLEVELRDRHCAYPYCTRSAKDCDCDHIVPFKPDGTGGPTCPCNLAPLCRHHHRLKTHAGWSYTTIEPGTYLWTDRYGQQLIRDADGTHAIEPSRRSAHALLPVDGLAQDVGVPGVLGGLGDQVHEDAAVGPR